MALLSSSLFFFLFLLLPLICLSAQPYTNISLGTIFTPLGSPTSWPSPNGDFAFGFRRLDSDPTRFLLAIWFDKIPNKTVVWTANGGKPVTNDSAAQLTSDGQLSLQDPAGNEVWNGSVKNATSASMLDSGNLVLSRSGFGTIWQTFDHPTDTILPGQVLKHNARVFAKLTDDDYSRGRFMLTLQDDGNLVLRPVAYPTVFGYIPYWSTETSNSGDNVLVFNQSTGSLYLAYPNSTDINVCTGRVSTEDYYVRATLDPDGVFRTKVQKVEEGLPALRGGFLLLKLRNG